MRVVALIAGLGLGLLAAAPAAGTAGRSVAPARPHIVARPIPFGPQRRAETAAYARRHYGPAYATWKLVHPRVIVEHYTVNESFSATWNTFAPDHPDAELHELPGTCAHFVIDKDGTIYQLVSLDTICRHTVGLNYTAIGIEHVGMSASEILHDPAQMAASLRLTRWLMARYGISAEERDRPRREPVEPVPPRARRPPPHPDPRGLDARRDDRLPGAAERARRLATGRCRRPPRSRRSGRRRAGPRFSFGPDTARLAFLGLPALATLLLALGGGVQDGDWYPWAFVTTLGAGLLLALDLLRPRRGPGIWAALAFLALAVWTLLSTFWALLPGTAFVEGARSTFYAATFVLVLTAVRSRRDATWLVAVLAASAAGSRPTP